MSDNTRGIMQCIGVISKLCLQVSAEKHPSAGEDGGDYHDRGTLTLESSHRNINVGRFLSRHVVHSEVQTDSRVVESW